MKRMQKKAEMGMGTLIIFIAMILVAAVAASVLITTTGSLQGKALNTGSAAKDEIGTNLQVVEMYGSDIDNDQLIDVINLSAKLAPGSESVEISGLLLLVDGAAVTIDSSTLYGGGAIGTTLDPNEIGTFQFNVTNLAASTTMTIQIVPEIGTSTVLETTTPANIVANGTALIHP